MEKIPSWMRPGATWTETETSFEGAKPVRTARTYRVTGSTDDPSIEMKAKSPDGDEDNTYSPDDLVSESRLLEERPDVQNIVELNGESFYVEKREGIPIGGRNLDCLKLIRYVKMDCERCGGEGNCSDCSGSSECPECSGSRQCQNCDEEGNCPNCGGDGNCTNCEGEAKCSSCEGAGRCVDCEGSGTAPGETSGGECGDCGGTGNCGTCEGAGRCVDCEGRGRIQGDGGFVRCDSCNGTGKCMGCQGFGKCGTCRGTGQTVPENITSECGSCGGTGRCAPCAGTGSCEECKGTRKCSQCNGTGRCIQCGGSRACSTCHGSGKCSFCNGTLQCRDCGGKGKCRYGSNMWFELSSLLLVRARKNCNGKLTMERDVAAASFLGLAAPPPQTAPSYTWDTGASGPATTSAPRTLQFEPLTLEQPIQEKPADAMGPQLCPSCGGAIKSNVSKFCTFCGKSL